MSVAVLFSLLPDSLRLSTSPPSDATISCAFSLVAQGSLARIEMFAVRMRFRSALNATGFGMPSFGAGAPTAAVPTWAESTPWAVAPPTPPGRGAAAVGALAAEQAARKSGAASKRASLRI